MRATIDRFEADQAVLEFPDGGTCSVPRGELPPDAKEGDVLTVTFSTNASETERRVTGAKDILNELLGGVE